MTIQADVAGAPEPWRERLSRRLAQLTAAITPLAFAPIFFGTRSQGTRIGLIFATLFVLCAFLYLARPSVAPKVRSIGVVSAFAAIGALGSMTVGLLSGPGVAFAISVAVAGLLLGRRAMLITALACGALVAQAGVLMVHGVIPGPALQDIAPQLVRPWLRSAAISMLLIVSLGAIVTWSVQTIEAALSRGDEEAKRRHEAELRALDSQRRDLMVQLAGGLAHDVNNQLTIISTWNSLLALPHRLANPQQAISAIGDAVTNAAALTKQLLVLGRRDVRKLRPMALADLVRSSETSLRRFLPDDIEVRIEATDPAWCCVDEAQINSVLLNLAVNARDAMPRGGALTIRTLHRRTTGDTPGVHRAIPAGDWAVLEVVDAGSGMDEATRERAFAPFYTTKKPEHGSGLGLATVAAIAELSDGHVELDSGLGRGTRIAVWLPTVEPAAVPSQAARETPPSLQGLRVLLAEDTPGVLAAAREALTQAGCAVVTATDGDEALARTDESKFDMLCSDVVMPGAPVTDVIDAALQRNPQCGVLLCSGYVAEELVRRGIEQGRYHFLHKPYGAAELLEAVARAKNGSARDIAQLSSRR